MAMIVYLIRCNANGKCYVGKTTMALKERWWRHCAEVRMGRKNYPLYRDMRTLGIGHFDIEELGRAQSMRRLGQIERKFIRLFNSIEAGYNQTAASTGGRIKKRAANANAPKSAEQVRKMRESALAWRAQKKAAA